jgi:DNA-directed RNA polymerase specialized sigma24 family protein
VPLVSEHAILQARAEGTVSAEVSFEQLYSLYKRPVTAWLMVRLPPADADEAAQDVWTIFYRRWRTWRFPEEIAAEAKPVLSFLYRTCHLTVAGRRRVMQRERAEELDRAADLPAPAGAWQRDLELRQCLDAARRTCSSDELEIVMGKLSGVAARAIATTLRITESAVDHGYRRAIAKVRDALGQTTAGAETHDE